MQAVILAAGRGERMRSITSVKPLLPVLGVSLLERAIRVARHGGVNEIIIVTGHQHDAIQRWHQDYLRQPGAARIILAHNAGWESTENGTSLLAAAPHIRGPFLLLMADHVYTPELIASLLQATPPADGAILAVDRRLDRTDIDLDDVTRVALKGPNVVEIDKGLASCHGYDTGAFLCSPNVLQAMQHAHDAGRTRISDVMQTLASQGQLLAHDISGMYWQDVDTPEMLRRAEEGLLTWAAGKPADGLVARRLNRPLSRLITRHIAHTRISPNQISLIAFVIGIVAACLLASGPWWALAVGGLLVQLASVVDGCDGELARLRFAPSDFGGWFDALLDRYADAAILAGLTWHTMLAQQNPAWMWLGILAISGSFVASYSAHKADRQLPRSAWRMGRDTRSLIVMIGALLAMPIATLWVIAITMNLAVVYRLMAYRRAVATKPAYQPDQP